MPDAGIGERRDSRVQRGPLPARMRSLGSASKSYEPLEIIPRGRRFELTRRGVSRSRWPGCVPLSVSAELAPQLSRNAGIPARGDLLAFLDADDVWDSDHLRLLLPHLLADPQLRFVWGTTRISGLTEDAADTRTYEVVRENVPIFLLGSALYRTSVFTEVGRFDPDAADRSRYGLVGGCPRQSRGAA